ncbi:MAG: lysoplasmalogenase [Thermoguttaceae bacterium]|nr:lysoplasmalogenase [Thermoguttaceae bacterium]
MKNQKSATNSTDAALVANLFLLAVGFVLNVFYWRNGFAFPLKCACSAGFATLAVVNATFAFALNRPNRRFYVAAVFGLLCAALGDVLIGFNFVWGAAAFGVGHLALIVAFSTARRFGRLDAVLSVAIFLFAAAFLNFFPGISFATPALKSVCVGYAAVISAMLGKAVGNFAASRTVANGAFASGAFLFFFSDTMLALNVFVGRWAWTDAACLATYFPAVYLLAFSLYLTSQESGNGERSVEST